MLVIYKWYHWKTYGMWGQLWTLSLLQSYILEMVNIMCCVCVLIHGMLQWTLGACLNCIAITRYSHTVNGYFKHTYIYKPMKRMLTWLRQVPYHQYHHIHYEIMVLSLNWPYQYVRQSPERFSRHQIFLALKPEYFSKTKTIPWLQMAWLLTSQGHQRPWCWLCRINVSFSSTRRDFDCLFVPSYWREMIRNANVYSCFLK